MLRQDYTHYHLDTNLTRPELLSSNVTTFNLALLGVLANLHGSVSPQYRPFVDVLMQAISRWGQTGWRDAQQPARMSSFKEPARISPFK